MNVIDSREAVGKREAVIFCADCKERSARPCLIAIRGGVSCGGKEVSNAEKCRAEKAAQEQAQASEDKADIDPADLKKDNQLSKMAV